MIYVFIAIVIMGGIVFMWRISIGLHILMDLFRLRQPMPPKPKEAD
ncbi:hypothetical protein LCGC14_1866870 [marine sediment metagenome]|uniref:Uncharacterized protein n=1 Tax=marine sediment metagenome TaxID=412755 RepID=A0A0F9IK74_9ZZZZ